MTTKNTTADSKVHTAFHAFKKMVDEQFTRMENMYAEYGRYEKQGIEQANATIDELARLMKDSVDYSRQLSAEWRKMAKDATKRAAEMWSAAAIP
jgi:hypothetical protein